MQKQNTYDPFFPFSTCEKSSDHSYVKQPVSAFVNAITCMILLYFIFIARTWTVKFLIFTFFLFELFHTFSHIQHVNGHIQAHIIHTIWYILSITLLFTILTLSKTRASLIILSVIFIIITIDIYLWIYYTETFTMILRGFFLIIFIIISHYNLFPKAIKSIIPYLVLGTIIEAIIIYNEKINCQKMMDFIELPYHAMSELLGLILFTYIAYIFIIWENTIHK